MSLTRRRFLLLAAAASVVAPARRETWDWRGDALGAEARIVLSGARDAAQAALAEVAAEIDRLENIFSLHRPSSQLARLNRDGALTAPARDLTEALRISAHWRHRTEGAFDPAVQPLWTAAVAGTPAPLERVRAAGIVVAPGLVRLSPGTALTLNGIAQGVIADRVAALLTRRGFASPRIDTGEMRLPGNERRRLRLPDAGLELEVADCAVATSAPDALRFPGLGGIISSTRCTGRSPEHWRAVTVIAPTAADADALSTAFAVSPPERIGDLVPADTLVLATDRAGRTRRFGRARPRCAGMTPPTELSQASKGGYPMQTRSGLLVAAPRRRLLAAPAFAQGDAAAGEKVFNKCKACHQVGPEAKNRVGPVLNGVIGREIASTPDFNYSDAFLAKKAEGFTWTEENLTAYLDDPKGFIEGNKMSFAGLRKPEEISDVIAYLATFP